MKKTLAFALMLVMVISCFSGIFAVVAETSAEPFWVTHYDDDTAEGAGIIMTETDSKSVWCDHYAFKPIEGVENGYELVDLSYGTVANGDDTYNGHGTQLEVPEGGFVYVTSIGNDYPSIGMEGPNYVNDNCNAQISRCRTWEIGDRFIITGLDLEGKTVPTTTPDTPWYEDSYVCTATIEAYEATNTPAGPTNVALGKKYVTSPLYRQGGADVNWGWDENANIAYPDTGDVELTDGIFPPADASYSDPAFFGFSGSPDYVERGYAYIRVDLEEAYDLSKLVLYVGSSGLGAGISASGMTVSYYKVDDLEGTNPVELGSTEAVDDAGASYVPVPLETEVNAQFIEIRIVRGGWMFVTEFEAYTGAAGEEPVEPEPVDPSVSVTVTKGDVNFNEDALGKLVDGDRDLGATAFGSAGLTYFQNPGFRDGNATVEIIVDLGAVKTAGSVYADFFRDDNDTTGSFISLPSAVEITVSADGKDYYDVNAGNAVAIAEGTDLAMNTIAVDFTTRVALKVRYIKAVVTFDNEWIFLSEIGVGAASENGVPLDPAAPFAYTEGTTPRFGIGLYTEAGDYDLSNNEEGVFFKSAQIVVAAFDASTGAYKISKNAVNPWPDGHAETITLSEGEILMAITTAGNINAASELDTIYAGLKWIVRGLKVGDYVVLDTENKTASFYPSTHEFSTSEEPEVESVTDHFTQAPNSSAATGSVTLFPAGDEEVYVASEVAGMRWSTALIANAEGTIVSVARQLLSEAQDANGTFKDHGFTIPAGGCAIVYHSGDNSELHLELQDYTLALCAEVGLVSDGAYTFWNSVVSVEDAGWQIVVETEGGDHGFGYATFYKGAAPAADPEPERDPEYAGNVNVAAGKDVDVKTAAAIPQYSKADLTDGVTATTMGYGNPDTEWFSFYYNANYADQVNVERVEIDGTVMNVGNLVIDLAEYYAIGSFRIHYNKDFIPETTNIYVSADGVTYTKVVGKATTAADGTVEGAGCWIEFPLDEVSAAQYVKVEFIFSGMFAMLDEVEVYSVEAECKHENTTETTVPATCTEDGYTEVVCDDCDEVLSHEVIPALGHDYVDGVCTRCGEEDPDYTPDDPTVLALGDVDGNGVVDEDDYVAIKRYVLKSLKLTDAELALADIDGNGVVDEEDYLMVKRHVLHTFTLPGWETEAEA